MEASGAFNCIKNGAQLRAAALGFVRTYAYLIQSKLDYDEAQRLKLIDPSMGYAPLLRFLQAFSRNVNDEMVTKRYRFGELRLSRINFFIKFCRFERYYHQHNVQYGPYLAKLAVPFIFAFAVLSAVLGAMQVGIAAIQLRQSGELAPHDALFNTVSYNFAITSMGVCIIGVAFIPFVLVLFLLMELVYSLKKACSFGIRSFRRRERPEKRKTRGGSAAQGIHVLPYW